MIDPEPADGLIGVCQSIAVGRHGVSEPCRIEVHADVSGFRRVDPGLKVFGQESVAFELATAGLGIAGVKVRQCGAG